MPEPTLFTIPSGAPFARRLAQGLIGRYAGGDPLALAEVRVFLPTRRAVRALGEALRLEAAARGSDALLLPDIRALGDVDEDELLTLPQGDLGAEDLDLPPAINETRRRLILARLVERWVQDRNRAGQPVGTLNAGQRMALATDLARTLDQLHTEGATFEELDRLVPDHFAEHWKDTVEFLAIVSHHWPDILRQEGALDPADRRNRLLRALAVRWRAAPPAGPVIAAGSTGSIPATAELLSVIARLPQGAVVLPGLDPNLDDETWAALDPSHPQYGLKLLLDGLQADRRAVSVWPEAAADAKDERRTAREALLSLAFLPGAATERWAANAPGAATEQALSGLHRIDAADPAHEADIIALIFRHALETPDRTAALVTPDRTLARRVSAAMRRWNIDVDDSAGRPLDSSPEGVLLRLILQTAVEGFAPSALLGLLKHELCRLGLAPRAKQAALATLEIHACRGLKPPPGFGPLRKKLTEARLEDGQRDAALLLLDRLEAAFCDLTDCAKDASAAPARCAAAHRAAADLLATEDANGSAGFRQSDAGEKLARLLDDLETASPPDGLAGLAEYRDVFERLMAGQQVRPRRGGHPRLFIWGPLEARLQHADVLILGGLNESSWPGRTGSDPWLNRLMRHDLGLPDPERRIGLAAHDVMQSACAPHIYLTRAAKADGTPQLPSRWLLRLDAVTGDRHAACEYPYADWARRVDRRAPRQRIGPPAPRPPREARPRALAVTDVERLVRDPYAIYARHVLGLRALDPLGAEPGPAERGTFVHRALQRFAADTGNAWPDDEEDALNLLLETGRRHLIAAIGPAWHTPETSAFWSAQFEAAARWFIGREMERRPVQQPLKLEVRGRMELNAGLGFTLTAKADRIDRRADGQFVVIDYKTGRMPSRKQVETGFAPQLPLEGAILRAGGFEDVPQGEVSQLLYIQLSGRREDGVESAVAADPNESALLIGETLAGLARLVAQMHDPETPFLSRPRVQYLRDSSDYDHLARVREWSAGGAEDGE